MLLHTEITKEMGENCYFALKKIQNKGFSLKSNFGHYLKSPTLRSAKRNNHQTNKIKFMVFFANYGKIHQEIKFVAYVSFYHFQDQDGPHCCGYCGLRFVKEGH